MMNFVFKLLTFLMSILPSRAWPQQQPTYDSPIFIELDDVDDTQSQLEEIKKQIRELQKRFDTLEIRNPLRRLASSPNINTGYIDRLAPQD